MKKILFLLSGFTILTPLSINLYSCQDTQLEPPVTSDKQLFLKETVLTLPKTGVYDDGNQHLVFEDHASNNQPIYQYHGETVNNANLAVNDQDTLSMMKGKNAIELRKNDTVVVDLNFINEYRQFKQEKPDNFKPIDDFTDVWYKYFTIFDTKASGAGSDSWQDVNQTLWTEDLGFVNNATNHKLVYNETTKSYFASIKASQDVWNPAATEFSQDNVFDLKLASDKHHLFVTCYYDQTFVHDYFYFSFLNLDSNGKRVKIQNNQYYQRLWESGYIMCNLAKTTFDASKINVSKTGWTASIIDDLKKDKWFGYLMGTKSIDQSNLPRYYNCMLYTPSALYKDSSWYYYAKYTAMGVEGFKGYSRQVEPIKIGYLVWLLWKSYKNQV